MKVKHPYPSPLQANYALAMLLVAYILSYVDRQILTLLVGPIREDLQISDFQLSLLHGVAFAVFYAFMGIPIARLADRYSRRVIISSGILFWSTMTVFCGLTKQFSTLFIARMGVGLGEAALSPPAYSMLSDQFAPEKLGRAMSIFTAGISIGAGCAYILGGWVIELVNNSDPLTLPFFGQLTVWQSCFIIVGIPGFVIAALMLTVREPKRQGLSAAAATEQQLPFKEVLKFLLDNRRVYAPIFLSVTLLGIVGTGTFAWFPSSLMRSYGVEASEVGYRFGLIVLLAGTTGSILSGIFAEKLTARYTDANMRTVWLVSLALFVPAIATPLMTDFSSALWMAVPLMFFLSAFFGVSIAALQLVTPNEMRAQIAALFLFCTNMIGMAVGPMLIAAVTEFVFKDDAALRYSLALVTLLALPLASLAAYCSLKPYRQALAAGKVIEEKEAAFAAAVAAK
jgi:MFS family permease